MRDITMWCPRCEIWTREYSRSGHHDCGTEVISTGDEEEPLGLDFEG